MDYGNISIKHRNLPHWHRDCCIQFITFHLADSLPASVRVELQAIKERFIKLNPEPWSDDVRTRFNKMFLNEQDEYTKTRNYWKYLKSKLRTTAPQLVSATNQLKLKAADGKSYKTDVLDAEGVTQLAKVMPNNKAIGFLDWFTYSENTLDGRSRKKAYDLFESGLLKKLEPGSVKCLQQIHAYIFGGLYEFAGQIRTKNISNGGFTFANRMHFPSTLQMIERMPETTFDEIMDKYVEMNVAHPFMEGNGRSTRIWLDLMLKRSLKKCVDWSQIDKNEYLQAMQESVADSSHIKSLVQPALTSHIDDREMFMKGIDYSYYYEQND